MIKVSFPKIAIFLVAIALPCAVKAMPTESIFFTPDEVLSVMRANQGFISREDAGTTMDTERRVIALAGIAFRGAHDWTIWLNGERITPKNIPEPILGLTVKKDRIHLKWVDSANQRIVNLTLRPHQKYDLDSDAITPGT